MSNRIRIEESVMEKITKMGPTELKEIEKKISVLKSLKRARNNSDRSETELALFYQIIIDELFIVISSPKVKFEVFRKKDSYKKLVEAFDFINEFLKLAMGCELTQRDKQRGYILFAKLMIEHQLKWTNKPLTIQLVLNSYQRFPGLVDKAYPQYIRNGCGKFIFGNYQNPKDLKL